jgi:hypothetical protein
LFTYFNNIETHSPFLFFNRVEEVESNGLANTLIICDVKARYQKTIMEPFLKGEYSKIDRQYINSKDKYGNPFFPESYSLSVLFKAGDNQVKFCAVRKDDASASDSCKQYPEALANWLNVPYA